MATINSNRKISPPIDWEGKYNFLISGTDHVDDSLQIQADIQKMERLLSLTLPTLCITFADLDFANAIGGKQLDYPDSAAYGPVYFDPPIELSGEYEIRKFTWIRGAQQVLIGAKETTIRWLAHKKLVIPKLHIASKKPIQAMIQVPQVQIHVDQPLKIKTMQLCDGRIVGGVELNKFHPDWREDLLKSFDLQVKVTDEKEGNPISSAKLVLELWHEDGQKYVDCGSWLTEKDGMLRVSGIDCVGRVRLSIAKESYISQSYQFLVFSGQEVKRIITLSQNKYDKS